MKKSLLTVISVLSILVLAACGSSSASDDDVVQIGVVGENNEVWNHVIDKLADQGIEAELVRFSDYNTPNRALENEEIDLNSFQHIQFLETYNEDSNSDLQPIAETLFAPLGVYSEQINSIEEFSEGDTITIPNDASNGGRSLLLLQSAGLIEIDPEAGVTPTVDDITSNPLNLQIEPLDAASTARSMSDSTAAIINSGMAVDAGLVPTEDAIYLEEIDESTQPYVNVIAARPGDDKEIYQKVIEAYQSEDTAQVIEETSVGSQIPAWME